MTDYADIIKPVAKANWQDELASNPYVSAIKVPGSSLSSVPNISLPGAGPMSLTDMQAVSPGAVVLSGILGAESKPYYTYKTSTLSGEPSPVFYTVDKIKDGQHVPIAVGGATLPGMQPGIWDAFKDSLNWSGEFSADGIQGAKINPAQFRQTDTAQAERFIRDAIAKGGIIDIVTHSWGGGQMDPIIAKLQQEFPGRINAISVDPVTKTLPFLKGKLKANYKSILRPFVRKKSRSDMVATIGGQADNAGQRVRWYPGDHAWVPTSYLYEGLVDAPSSYKPFHEALSRIKKKLQQQRDINTNSTNNTDIIARIKSKLQQPRGINTNTPDNADIISRIKSKLQDRYRKL